MCSTIHIHTDIHQVRCLKDPVIFNGSRPCGISVEIERDAAGIGD
jgi:hypothetical protein